MGPYAGSPTFGRLLAALLLAVLPINLAAAYDLDVNSTDSIKSIAKDLAFDMMTYYHGDEPGQIPGVLPEPPYYWWEGGALMGALIEYWYYTKDTRYMKLTQQGLLFQIGDNKDYMPKNQTLTEGNDDQGFWGLAVMSAAEYNFPHPGGDNPSWLALAQAVFNTQAPRWDNKHCNGGLRWQIYDWNKGWDYKNSISQGTFFALAARLALYTDNSTYAEWADKTWDWMIGVGFIDKYWYVYDGAHIPTNCTEIVPWQFTYNAGTFILGAAAMYNYTEKPEWKHRLDGLLKGAKVFMGGKNKDIMTEVSCETVDRCNEDQQSFKAYLSRWFAAITQWVPDTYDTVMPWLQASAIAATKQCQGGKNGRMCGLKWSSGKYDKTTGVGQQMAALEVTLACMIKQRDPILTSHTGGTSKSDPGAGSGDIGRDQPVGEIQFAPITPGERAAGAIITVVVIGLLMAGVFWMLLDETSDKGPVDQIKGSAALAAAAVVIPGAVGGAAVLRKRNTQGMTEKTPRGQAAPEPIDNQQATIAVPTPIRVSRVESVSGTQSRRRSSMPLGWPHNPSIRSSLQVAPGSEPQSSDRPISGQYQVSGSGSGSGSRSGSPAIPSIRPVSPISETDGVDRDGSPPTPPPHGAGEVRPSPRRHTDDDEIRPASSQL